MQKQTKQMPHSIIARWGELGRLVKSKPNKRSVDWRHLQVIIEAARPYLNFEEDRIRELLQRSSVRLRPLRDPLEEDYGVHRWLTGAREEVYSDWLAWIFQRLGSPHTVIKLALGCENHDLPERGMAAMEVRRELGVADEKGSRMRTDIEISIGSMPLILIEVKKVAAESVNQDQLRRQAEVRRGFRHYKLLAPHGEEREYPGGFTLRLWSDLCRDLRRLVPQIVRGKDPNLVLAAMIVGFVGAVEQNILGFPGGLSVSRRIAPGARSFLRAYLEQNLTVRPR